VGGGGVGMLEIRPTHSFPPTMLNRHFEAFHKKRDICLEKFDYYVKCTAVHMYTITRTCTAVL
jgi:hypothetical protein